MNVNNQSNRIVWYEPPFAPSGSSAIGEILLVGANSFRSVEQLSIVKRIDQIVYRFFVATHMAMFAIMFDLVKWVWVIRSFDSVKNELQNLISILISPFFALGFLFGYIPKVNLFKGSFKETLDFYNRNNPAFTLNFVWLENRIKENPQLLTSLSSPQMIKLLDIAIDHKNENVFRVIFQSVKNNQQRFNDVRQSFIIHLLDNPNKDKELRFFRILLELGNDFPFLDRDFPLTNLLSRNHSAPFLELIAKITCIFSHHLDLEINFLHCHRKKLVENSAILIRAGHCLSYNLDMIKPIFQYMKGKGQLIFLDESRYRLGNRFIPASLIHSLLLHQEGVEHDTANLTIDNFSRTTCLQLKKYRAYIFPYFSRMQELRERLREHEENRSRYYSSEEFDERCNKMIIDVVYNVIGSDRNISSIIVAYFFLDDWKKLENEALSRAEYDYNSNEDYNTQNIRFDMNSENDIAEA